SAGDRETGARVPGEPQRVRDPGRRGGTEDVLHGRRVEPGMSVVDEILGLDRLGDVHAEVSSHQPCRQKIMSNIKIINIHGDPVCTFNVHRLYI
ncbi:MAG: hypothetical protein ACREQJ_07070, partial [Candidatus Binatia bacterium]